MLTITAQTSDGFLVALTQEGRALMPAEPVSGATSTLDLDETTNAPLVADLVADPRRYRLLAGVLSKGGVAATIAPDSQDAATRRQWASLLQAQRDYLALATPTAAQDRAANVGQARIVLLLARLAQRNGGVLNIT